MLRDLKLVMPYPGLVPVTYLSLVYLFELKMLWGVKKKKDNNSYVTSSFCMSCDTSLKNLLLLYFVYEHMKHIFLPQCWIHAKYLVEMIDTANACPLEPGKFH